MEKGLKENNLSEKERQDLVLAHLGQVKIIVKNFLKRANNNSLEDDMLQEGYSGLVKASVYFNPSKDVQFQTYASRKIEGAILDFLRREDLLSRDSRKLVKKLERIEKELGENFDIKDEEGLAARLGVDLKNKANKQTWDLVIKTRLLKGLHADVRKVGNISASEENNPKLLAQKEEQSGIMQKVLENSGLNAQERLVIMKFFYEYLKQREVADIMGLHETRVSQIKTSALEKIKKYMEANNLSSDLFE